MPTTDARTERFGINAEMFCGLGDGQIRHDTPPVTDRFGTRSHGFNDPGHDEFVRGSVHDLASTQGYTGPYVSRPLIEVMSGLLT